MTMTITELERSLRALRLSGMTATLETRALQVALTLWRQMRLHSACHDVYWDASASELQSIYEHLGAPWFDAHRNGLVGE